MQTKFSKPLSAEGVVESLMNVAGIGVDEGAEEFERINKVVFMCDCLNLHLNCWRRMKICGAK